MQRCLLLLALLPPLTGAAHFDRIGEADVPGPPPGTLRLTTSNPSGLRGKEAHLIGLGPGVHCLSETQLSFITLPRCQVTLRHQAGQSSRLLRCVAGPPVACRTGSRWAGTWAGVLTTSDVPCQKLSLPWQCLENESGRLVASAHHLGNTKLQVVNVYGFCRGPTWPQAKQLTENLLSTVTSHYVIGGFGIRTICGDFNFSEYELDSFAIWRQYGWISAQRFASFHWGHAVQYTCKGVTERDFVWLSPEAQALCCNVEVLEVFIEHATVAVDFTCDVRVQQVFRWPLPARIPWDHVHKDGLEQLQFTIHTSCSTTSTYGQIGSALESSLAGRVHGQPGGNLLPHQLGRAQRLGPNLTDTQVHFCRPSRQGEVQLRSDQTTLAVRYWFRQLRRLQSLRHAIRAGNLHIAAQVSRCELWSSILRARGFDQGFRAFWDSGEDSGVPHDPAQLPCTLPTLDEIDRIYHTFRARFDKFESWHIRQRCQLLKAKHEASMSGLYGELRKQPKAKPDLLWHDHYYTILDFERDSASLHLEKPLDLRGHSTWTINGVRTTVLDTDGDLCLVSSMPQQLVPGDELHQHQVLSDLADVHQDFVDFWRPRWNAYSDIPEADWRRIVNFARAHMKPIQFDLPEIQASHWSRALRRYKPTAARGVDGLDHRDFSNMPQELTDNVLQLLRQIERGAPWPQQTHVGVIQALAKTLDAHEASAFRPIVVFSILYRTWGSIRSRQLLAQLSRFLPEEQVGFVPGQEAAGIWAYWQALIELSCCGGSALCGLSSDIVRAFNCLPRRPLLWMISHIGTPSTVTGPWDSFLASMSRSFMVQGALSTFSGSQVGFPEGDALSVFAMCVLDWTWHLYVVQYCPSVRAYSYVDNLGLLGANAGSLAVGFTTMTAFFKLWRLELDLGKSYCWAVDGDNRKALDHFPVKRLEHASELGGSLTFSSRPRVGDIKARMAKLDDRWSVLQRSSAALPQKLLALATVFWPEGLHGILSCRLAYSHLDALRRKAALALGWRKAGSSPAMRFLLSEFPFSDPLLWHHKTVLQDFRRLCRKSSDFYLQWSMFLAAYCGELLAGPFSKLLELVTHLGWSFSSPDRVVDHWQVEWSLLKAPWHWCLQRILDAWAWLVARDFKCRASATDLDGIDLWAHSSFVKSLSSVEKAQLSALSSGSFVDSSKFSKYDLAIEGTCPRCQCPDTLEHWFSCPRWVSLNGPFRDSFPDWDTWPTCFRHHVLLPHPHLVTELDAYFAGLPDGTNDHLSKPVLGMNHVFTDGALSRHRHSRLEYAAWAAVSATTGRVISGAPLHGVCQAIGRAELQALLSTVKWGLREPEAEVHVWSDSQHVASGASFLQATGSIPSTWEHQDLWHDLSLALDASSLTQFVFHWVPSHLEAESCESPFEDWIQKWNGIVDRVAGSLKPPALHLLWNFLRRSLHMTCDGELGKNACSNSWQQLESREQRKRRQPCWLPPVAPTWKFQ
ncbi:Putative ATP-dependent RNA helicase DHX57 [Durusdinium trenchii]|uniref:ATP-dependent RNA helicase DHX57 n=1 Tax=Durusdinium trenchii TaxID=1381693 RepID=A0ABP0J8U2_9DINO